MSVFKEPGVYNLKKTMEQQEKEHITNVLVINKWHQGKAAEDLGINSVTLHLKMKKYGLLRSQQGPYSIRQKSSITENDNVPTL